MRITEAARLLGTSPRMLRYRDTLGLLPGLRSATATSRRATTPHRQFCEADLDAVALALAIEHSYDISPAALAFGLRVLAEPPVRAEVAELARRIGRVPAPAARALDFEQERALRLLSMPRRPRQPTPAPLPPLPPPPPPPPHRSPTRRPPTRQPLARP